ncbi:MAG: sugar ABC transporter ATP-binding protein, partial [Chlorogloeopsis fritschii C42_A2020_084]|nr:sugar ABC transporter ATP-binding protein [Chlorogloeopsis fritschii C42_A2020_084]
MAQVVLENVYKSFPPRKGESVALPTQLTSTSDKSEEATTPKSADSVNVLRRINLTVADGEFMVL